MNVPITETGTPINVISIKILFVTKVTSKLISIYKSYLPVRKLVQPQLHFPIHELCSLHFFIQKKIIIKIIAKTTFFLQIWVIPVTTMEELFCSIFFSFGSLCGPIISSLFIKDLQHVSFYYSISTILLSISFLIFIFRKKPHLLAKQNHSI